MSGKWLMGGRPSGAVPGGDVLPHGWGAGRLGLGLECFDLLLEFPHDSPAAGEVHWAWEQLCTLTLQLSAFLKSAARLSHCGSSLSLGGGLGEGSRERKWPLSANISFSLEASKRPRDSFFFCSGV